MINYKRPSAIKGLSEQRRLPRLGKIRLGIKKVSQKTGNEFPAETSYFVIPAEVAKVYGETPTELDVMIPVEDTAISIPQAYEMYGTGKGLKCIGDGEIAYRNDEKTQDMTEIECPCEHLGVDCKQRAHLRVILPKVNVGGVYQIDTSSYNSIIDLNSSMDYIRALIGRVALVPLKLKRKPTETHHDGKKQTHYTLKLELEADINFINQLRENTQRILLQSTQYSLPPPITENPAIDYEAKTMIINEEKENNAQISAQEKKIEAKQQKQELSRAIDANKVITGISKITSKIGKKKDGTEYIIYTIYGDGDIKYNTFDKNVAEGAKTAKENGIKVSIGTKGDKYNSIISLDLVEPDFSTKGLDGIPAEPIDDIKSELLPF